MNREKEMKNHLQKLEKISIIDLYLQKCFDTDIQLKEIEKELAVYKKAYFEYAKFTHKIYIDRELNEKDLAYLRRETKRFLDQARKELEDK